MPQLIHGDCIEAMRAMPDCSVDAIVTDPPYGLGFMGKAWDALPPGREWADECLRVLKPGGHLLAFGGTRTWHRLAVAIEDAGFELRDSVAWMHGQGFPKAKGQLKPAFEPVVVARKPLAGTVAANVAAHGTGALNINACRVAHDDESAAWVQKWSGHEGHPGGMFGTIGTRFGGSPSGRWPANVVLDEDAAAELDDQSGYQRDGVAVNRNRKPKKGSWLGTRTVQTGDDVTCGGGGGASRFFYVAKASSSERPKVDGIAHPTVKPLALMRWLVRLVTPPGGVVLDPFAGSGTTLEAALLEGFDCIGIEREADYLPLIEARLNRTQEAA